MLKNISILFILILIVGCSTVNKNNSQKTPKNISNEPALKNIDDKATQNIPSESLFGKISEGMGQQQVHDLIGYPSDMHIGSSGKQWNPFYFGTDIIRTIYFYKGEGRLLFGGNGRIIKIEYDPTEDGYK